MRKALLLILVFFVCSHSYGQQTVVSGTVIDSLSKKPIPFALVKFMGSTAGARTDTSGFFKIDTRKGTDSLEVSFVGYQTQIFIIETGTETELKVLLSEQNKNLNTVVITPGENPAFEILRRVKKNKKQNNPDKLDAYQCEVYNRVRVDANNIKEEFGTARIFKGLEFVNEYVDTTDKNSLPALLSQSISDYYYKKLPLQEKELIKAVDVKVF